MKLAEKLRKRMLAPLQCHGCGRFIADADLASGKAMHRMLTPDSHLTSETWDTLCPKCHEKDRTASEGRH